MKWLSIFLILSMSATASDYTYSIGASRANVDYCWYGASQACFDFKLNVIRFEVEHKSGFAIRVGKAINKPSSTKITITNQTFKIKFTKYEEYELIYKYKYNDYFTIYGGIGYYRQTLPIYSASDNLIHYDEDNDNGYIVGVTYQLTPSLYVNLFTKITSVIGEIGDSCDKDCIDNWESKGSIIRHISIGLIIKF